MPASEPDPPPAGFDVAAEVVRLDAVVAADFVDVLVVAGALDELVGVSVDVAGGGAEWVLVATAVGLADVVGEVGLCLVLVGVVDGAATGVVGATVVLGASTTTVVCRELGGVGEVSSAGEDSALSPEIWPEIAPDPVAEAVPGLLVTAAVGEPLCAVLHAAATPTVSAIRTASDSRDRRNRG
jgi:hypothetical protein